MSVVTIDSLKSFERLDRARSSRAQAAATTQASPEATGAEPVMRCHPEARSSEIKGNVRRGPIERGTRCEGLLLAQAALNGAWVQLL